MYVGQVGRSDRALRKRLCFRLSLDTKLILHGHGPRICDYQPPPITSTSTPDGHQMPTRTTDHRFRFIICGRRYSVAAEIYHSTQRTWRREITLGGIPLTVAFLFPAVDEAFLYISPDPLS